MKHQLLKLRNMLQDIELRSNCIANATIQNPAKVSSVAKKNATEAREAIEKISAMIDVITEDEKIVKCDHCECREATTTYRHDNLCDDCSWLYQYR